MFSLRIPSYTTSSRVDSHAGGITALSVRERAFRGDVTNNVVNYPSFSLSEMLPKETLGSDRRSGFQYQENRVKSA